MVPQKPRNAASLKLKGDTETPAGSSVGKSFKHRRDSLCYCKLTDHESNARRRLAEGSR
jgi:hypothetical protein